MASVALKKTVAELDPGVIDMKDVGWTQAGSL